MSNSSCSVGLGRRYVGIRYLDAEGRGGAQGHLKQASKMECEVDWGLRLRV